ncbi:MAG: hypothetical protein GKS00_12635 [Alphaproteobacteria bacterium]|nr:hypothetical protein [Alphaproteobacteria bacterium]
MRTEDWPEFEPPDAPGFASLTKVSVRRPSAARGKKSDITDTLASMRAAPEFLNASVPPPRQEMRDVTPTLSTDIVSFWNDLRSSQALPSRDNLRASDIAARWPNVVLFRCEQPGDIRPDTTFATALRAHRTGEGTIARGVEITAMLSQWILSVARNSAERGEPIRDTSRFDTPHGPISYELAAVPFGAGTVDHVLCNIDRAPSAT